MGIDKNERASKGYYSPAGKPSKGKSSTGNTGIQWANVTLTQEQKARLRETTFDGAKALDTLAYFVETGHKLVISPKNDRGFVSATLIGYGNECPNAGAGVSGEGGTTERAILSLLLKLDILDGRFSFGESSPDDDFR